jgi:hypothetical protein
LLGTIHLSSLVKHITYTQTKRNLRAYHTHVKYKATSARRFVADNRLGRYKPAMPTPTHWGRWIASRSKYVGLLRRRDFAEAVGCSHDQLQRWLTMPSPPLRISKGFDHRLASALKIDRKTLFKEWSSTAPEDARAVASERPFDVPWSAVAETSRQQLADIPHGDFIMELARRYRLGIIDAIRGVEGLSGPNWSEAAAKANHLKRGEKIPDEIASLAGRMKRAIDGLSTAFLRYDAAVASDVLHDSLPGRDLPREKFHWGSLLGDFLNVMRSPGANEFLGWMTRHKEALESEHLHPLLGIDHILKLIDQRQRLNMLAEAETKKNRRGK